MDTSEEKAWAEKMAEHRRAFLKDKDAGNAPRDEASEGGNGTEMPNPTHPSSPPPASDAVLTIMPPGVSASTSSKGKASKGDPDAEGEALARF